jgi:hypothetical protein
MIARRWSIAAKLCCALGGSVAAAVAAATLANAYLSGHIVQRAAGRELQTAQAFFEASIGAEADRVDLAFGGHTLRRYAYFFCWS